MASRIATMVGLRCSLTQPIALPRASALRSATAGSPSPNAQAPALSRQSWRTTEPRTAGRSDDCCCAPTVQVTRAPATSLCTDFSRSPARRYQHGGEPMDDLVQIASLALLKAIDRFDPSRETTLSTFATPTILGELKRYFRDHGWAVHVPRSLKERAARVEEATEALWGELGRPPTLTEIARASDATPDQVLEAGQVASAYCAIALDIYEHESEGISPAERLGIEDPGFTTAEQAATLEPLMSSLNERQQEVLRLRFGEDLVHSEIGWRIGVSAMHASRLIKQSLAIMQKTASRQEQARSASRA
jgi:RNA polymerase sigma-B factor